MDQMQDSTSLPREKLKPDARKKNARAAHLPLTKYGSRLRVAPRVAVSSEFTENWIGSFPFQIAFVIGLWCGCVAMGVYSECSREAKVAWVYDVVLGFSDTPNHVQGTKYVTDLVYL